MNTTLDQSCLRALLVKRTASFSVGVRGAIAEFHWTAHDAIVEDDGDCRIASGLGAVAIALQGDEQLHEFAGGRARLYWLPVRAAQVGGEPGLHELGPDRDAVRAMHREHVLFDMGLALGHAQACVRTADRALIELLRAHRGESLLERGHPAMAAVKAASPHRVFVSARARIEVYQPIPSRARREHTPLGPHTHVLPALLNTPDSQLADLPMDARPVLFVHRPAAPDAHHG